MNFMKIFNLLYFKSMKSPYNQSLTCTHCWTLSSLV